MVFSVNGGNRQNVEAKPPVNSTLLSSLFWGGPFQQVIDLFHRYVLDYMYLHICKDFKGLPRQCSGKESATAGDTGSVPGLGRFPRGGNDNPLQHSCLGNPMARGAWWATAHGGGKRETQVSD